MKTIELDGKKMYLVQSVGQVPRSDLNSLYFEGLWYELGDKQPFLYKDHNGVEVTNGQTVWEVQKTPVDNNVDKMWQPESFIATSGLTEFQKSTYAIFTTKEAADMFVAENRPFELVTEDGVTVKEMTKIWCVEAKLLLKDWTFCNRRVLEKIGWLYFSTEQAANDYIKKKKLSLSLDMIENMMDATFDWSRPNVSDIWMALTNLANEQFKP